MNKTLETCCRCGKRFWRFESAPDVEHRCDVSCIHRGAPIDGIKVYCRTCGTGALGDARVPVYACAIHGACIAVKITPDPDLPSWDGAVCQGCDDWTI